MIPFFLFCFALLNFASKETLIAAIHFILPYFFILVLFPFFLSRFALTSFRIPFTHSLTLSALIHMASLIHLFAKHHRFHPNHCLSIGIATTVAVAAQYFSAAAAAAAVGQIKFAPTLCGLVAFFRGETLRAEHTNAILEQSATERTKNKKISSNPSDCSITTTHRQGTRHRALIGCIESDLKDQEKEREKVKGRSHGQVNTHTDTDKQTDSLGCDDKEAL